MRFTAMLLCAAASSALIAAPAAAQSVDRIVAFGDSYADDGNFFELTGIARPPVYANGRFSNGTNFVDTMGQLLGAPIDNFAIGGAFTGTGNTGFSNINGGPTPQGRAIPGFPTEVASFLAGGGPAAFPRVTGTFGPNDLAVVSIGGNDARFYELALGRTPTSSQIAARVAGAPAAAAISVAEATAGLNALVGAGARNITFLTGDTGRLPEVRGTPVAAIGTAFSNAYNAGIQSSLSNIAAGGVIVNYLDLTQIGNVVEANLAEFGLISSGACPIACVTTNPDLLDQYLFYVDQVHLTSRGFEIVGQYAVRQLEAPLHLQAQTDLGLQTASTFGSTLLGRLDLSNARSGAAGDGRLHFYVSGGFGGRDAGRSSTNLAYDVDVFGVTAGAEYDAGPGMIVGAAFNYSQPEADMTTATGKAEADAYQLGVYGGWAGTNAFAEAYGAYGWLDLETRRDAVIDTIAGETEGNTTAAGAKAGYLLGLGGWRIGPVIGVHYARADLDAYVETGDPVLTLGIDEQDVEALVGSAGIEARGSFDMGGFAATPYIALAAEKDFEGDSRTIRYAGTASPTIVNSFVLPDRSEDVYARLTAGASFALGGAFSLQVNGSTSFEQEGGDDFSGFVGLKIGF